MAYLSPDSGLLSLQDSTDYINAARSNLSSLPSKVTSESGEEPPTMTKEDVDDVYSYLDGIFTSMKKTYSVRCIVIPKLRPNSLVHVADPGSGVDGLFVINRMEVAVGTGPDSSFAMDLDLVEA